MPTDATSPTTDRAPARVPERVVAIVPVGSLDGAKSRLGAVLDAEERYDLTLRLARGTISAAVGASRVDEVLVITPDDTVRTLALDLGARPILQRDSGLNRGIVAARTEAIAGAASAIVILPIDLPTISSGAIDAVIAELDDAARPVVAMVPDRHGRGTNALLIAPPNAIDVCFGGDSAIAHQAAARTAGARLAILDGPLRLDLDTPEDLLIAEPHLLPQEPVDVG
jgi:2-phospho-L-lactate/phosphoenolpyruvate guanylyltransferase